MQGQGLRDKAQQFVEADCVVLGISFDSPAENADFRAQNDFPFALLSDTDRSVGATYEAIRPSDDPFADYPQRISYLIDPSGVISHTYQVSDPAGHAEVVLADLTAARR